MSNSHRQAYAVLMTAGAAALALICALNSSRWIGRTFPGFFVMSNRVIPSAALAYWPTSGSDIFQHSVESVDGRRVSNGAEVYSIVSSRPSGTVWQYTLSSAGRQTSFTTPSRRFAGSDWFLIFVPYLLSGLALALIGIVVWYSKPQSPASLALLLGGISGGIFAITGSDLYGPYWFFRIHILGEAFFPASLLMHLAAVFPVDRFRRYRRWFITLPYVVAAVLGIGYEVFLYQPAAYTLIHNLCMVYAGAGGIALLTAVVWDFERSESQLVRQRVRILLLGFLCGFAFPGALMFYSGITGGQVPVNYSGFTVALFPLSIGYAIVVHDLFEINAMVKRSIYYLAITASIAIAYFGFVTTTNFAFAALSLGQSRLAPLMFTLGVVGFINPIKDSIQRGVDRVFFRLRYNPKQMLALTGAALASTLELEEISSLIWGTVSGTLGVQNGGVFVISADHASFEPLSGSSGVRSVRMDSELILWMRDSGFDLRNLHRDAEANGSGRAHLRPDSEVGDARLLVPMLLKGELTGFVALGPKQSGAFFNIDDVDFLQALGHQGALSIGNAIAYREIRSLNAVLEQRVRERTAELSRSNENLQAPVAELEEAYQSLKRSQEELARAEKMATLGRLAAGIAHEMNTPLGASMTSLKLLRDLVDEYKESVSDPQVTPEDHLEVAGEMEKLVRSTADWLNKAGAHIRSLKVHTRALEARKEERFSVLQTINEVKLLLSHRIRLARCGVRVECEAGNPMLYGDAGKLGQVLTNLVSNAIDAYEEGAESREIRIEVAEEGDDLLVRVVDQGRGIAAADLSRVFDEFYTTKRAGEGTGLGLSIARDIVSNFFRGTITAESVQGKGSTFHVRLPRRAERIVAA